ncbi:hypothetical protein [Fictibacillus solisalsi]|uniref:hypothetical protein n=1 Tax=Fictibacillus solisalsi TaxID=459525 RepID=UPI000B196884|nr:hypothetical protein [Fictibacillus solisalsi]
MKSALSQGYKSTAVYGNEGGAGRAIKDSGIPREELFNTTKVNATKVMKRQLPHLRNY